MVQSISEYANNIVTLIIAITIVELILPNNKNKKYVMFACSLIIMLSVINPILAVLNSDIDVMNKISEIQNSISQAEYNSASNYDLDYNIYNTYINNLKENISSRLEEIGYEVLEAKINIDEKTYEPKEIEMRVKYSDGFIMPVVIDVFGSNNDVYEIDKNKIKELLSYSYGIDKEKIKINEY